MILFLVIVGGALLTAAFLIALFAWLPRIMRNAFRDWRRRRK